MVADVLAGAYAAVNAVSLYVERGQETGDNSIGQTPSVAGYIVAARSGMWRRIV
jgi:hypothetical protein